MYYIYFLQYKKYNNENGGYIMCTALSYKNKNTYFGRNFDYEFDYGEEVVITPRNYAFNFRHAKQSKTHFAIIGIAFVVDDYPLYFDGMNEKGLCVAGLNFTNNACYSKQLAENKDNISSFELIPYLLGNNKSIKEVKQALNNIEIVDTYFKDNMPNSPLHWLISDKDGNTITLECAKEGTFLYDNDIGVLTNNPPYPLQRFNLNNYQNLSEKQPTNSLCENIKLTNYSRGMGAIGLPGDLSSMSRFVRATFTKAHSLANEDENSNVSQFFHLLGSVEQQRGCCEVEKDKYEITIYSSCMSTSELTYYYKTYDNFQISAVDMKNEDLNSEKLIVYPLLKNNNINYQN